MTTLWPVVVAFDVAAQAAGDILMDGLTSAGISKVVAIQKLAIYHKSYDVLLIKVKRKGSSAAGKALM